MITVKQATEMIKASYNWDNDLVMSSIALNERRADGTLVFIVTFTNWPSLMAEVAPSGSIIFDAIPN